MLFFSLLGVTFIVIFSQVDFSNSIIARLFLNYDSSLAQADRMLADVSYGDSVLLKTLDSIAPGRMVYGVMMLIVLFGDSIFNILFGYGIGGIYIAFGRPPMMDILMIIGVYGLLGFLALYVPLLAVLGKLLKHKDFDLVGVLFFTILLYGSIGGFLFGAAGTISIFALLFGLMLSRYYRSSVKNVELI